MVFAATVVNNVKKWFVHRIYMEECTITFEDGSVINGACDPTLYEKHGENVKGFDPEWVSCFFVHQNYDYTGNEIYCFHPSQGMENSPVTEGKELIGTPKELPKTGDDFTGIFAIFLAISLVVIFFIYEKMRNGK
jgi:hypothetical protein